MQLRHCAETRIFILDHASFSSMRIQKYERVTWIDLPCQWQFLLLAFFSAMEIEKNRIDRDQVSTGNVEAQERCV
jgi:hypothetical protein